MRTLCILCALCALASAQIATSHVFEGAVAGDRHGTSVAGGSDLDGDGHDDIVVGTPLADTTSGSTTVMNSGNVTAYSGADGSVLWSIDGGNPFDAFGQSVVVIGDINADGTADVAVGAPSHDVAGSNSGQVKVLSGVDGSDLLVIDGSAVNERFGASIAAPGDVDQDGSPDLIAGAPFATNTAGDFFAGVARVCSGATGSTIWTFEGAAAGDQLGHAVGVAGDVDLDGIPDLVVGAYRNDAAGSDAGNVRVHAGVDGSLIWTVDGAAAGDWFGWCVASVGDVDADGRDDVAVGAPNDDTAGTKAGSVRILSGLDGSDLWRRDGSNAGDELGYALASIGDFDGDTLRDVAMGARYGATSLGASGYVMLTAAAGGALLATIPGDEGGDWFGAAVADAGDLDLDGNSDLVIGAPEHDLDPATTLTGRVRAYVQVPVVAALTIAAPATVDLGTPIVYTITSAAPVTGGTPYLMDVSTTGDAPGIPLPAPMVGTIPLNGPLLYQTSGAFWPNAFNGFAGHLDITGQATASLDPPLFPWFVGLTVHAACITLDPGGPMVVGVVSNGVATVIGAATPTITTISPATGATVGGYTATITGTDFLPGATVMFGTTAATNVSVPDGQTITCDVPAGMPGTVDVVVTNPGALQATLPGGFTWVATAVAPAVTAVSPATSPAAGGAALTLTGTDFAFQATVDIGGTPATNVVVVSGTTITCDAPSGVVGPAMITVTNPSGLSSAPVGFLYVEDLTIASVSQPYALAGTTVTLTGTGFDPSMSVTVGGVAVAPTAMTKTTIDLVVPANASCAGTIAVTGSLQSAQVPFNSAVTITGTVNPVGPVAGGGVFAVVGQGLGQVVVTVEGLDAAIVSQSDTAVFATAPPRQSGLPGSVTLTVTTPAGCTATETYTYQ